MVTLNPISTSRCLNFSNNPLCVLSNRYGVTSIDFKNECLLTGDILGQVTTWDLDLQSPIASTKLFTALVNAKFAESTIISQSKCGITFFTNDLVTNLQHIPCKSCTFAKFLLLNNYSIIACPHPEFDTNVSLFSKISDKWNELKHLKIKSDKNLGLLYVLKEISDTQFIISHEIGSLFIFDVRKLNNPITEPIFTNSKSPIHSLEVLNNVIYGGNAEGELYSISGNNVEVCYKMKSYTQPSNLGIGNIIKYEKFLILACWDSTVRVIDPVDFTEKMIFHGHTSTVTDLLVDLKDHVLFTSGTDGIICAWDINLIKTC